MSRFTFLRAALRLVPKRAQVPVFQRWLRLLLPRCPAVYLNVPLRHAPGVVMDLHPNDVIHGMIAAFGYYELPLTRALRDLALTVGGTLLDVGANYGYFSLVWTSLRADNRAEAVEASPRNLDALKCNIDRNNLGGRVHTHAVAAGNRDGIAWFDMGPEGQTGWGGITEREAPSATAVPLRKLDSLFAGRNVTALKIDCEGADALVIEGAATLLGSRAIKHVFFEENPGRMRELGIGSETAQRLLEKSGYRIEAFDDAEFHAWLE